MELKENLTNLATRSTSSKKQTTSASADREKGAADPLVQEKVDKANAAITRREDEVKALTKAAGRSGFGGMSEEEVEKRAKSEGAKKYAAELQEFMRTGKEISKESLEFYKKGHERLGRRRWILGLA